MKDQLREDDEYATSFYSQELRKEDLIISESEDEESKEIVDGSENINYDLVKELFVNSLIENERGRVQHAVVELEFCVRRSRKLLEINAELVMNSECRH